MPRYHLGLDSSTQSLTGVVIDLDTGRVVCSRSVNFSETFPEYGTIDGVLRGADPHIVHAPPRLWLDALDRLLDRMRADGAPFAELDAVSGSGQQHGSVYLNETTTDALARLDPARPLSENLAGIFSRPTAPVWMDASTARPCADITAALAAHGGVIAATGSAATLRFTGPQIRKFWQEDPEAYQSTRHIALVSSFMCSVFSGKIAPIDPGDGAGMNLMDIRERSWHPMALKATAPGLAARLPQLASSGTVIGPVTHYFVARHGFHPNARSVIWSGDNPCSAAGLGLIHAGMVAISMGTSYTYFGTMAACRVDPNGTGHVLGCPTGGYLSLLCFQNGGLARARVRDRYSLDWEGFRRAMASVPPGNHGRLMLPWFDVEIVPAVTRAGVHRLDLDEGDAAGNCRALVEAQMLAMKRHADWMQTPADLIYATGGASEDRSVLQVMADVFQCPVQTAPTTKSAALGAALIAAQATAGITWPELAARFIPADPARRIAPDPSTAKTYKALLARYTAFEHQTLATLRRHHAPDP